MGKWSGKQAATQILKTICVQATEKVFFFSWQQIKLYLCNNKHLL